MKFKKSLVWFRNNLRLSDNPALKEAIDNSEEIFLLYIFDQRHWESNPLGMQTSHQLKLTFLWDSVMALKKQIEKKGGHLHLVRGENRAVIKELNEKHDFDAFYAPLEAGVYEERDFKAIEEALMKSGVSVHGFSQSTLYHADDIPWPINKLPAVFTQFRKENEKQTEIRALYETPDDLSLCHNGEDEQDPQAYDIEPTYPSQKAALQFKGGEEEAFNRLQYYFWETDLIQNYKKTRNGLLGGDYSAKLSPYLALGCISPRSIYVELKKYEQERKSNQSTYWLFFELVWRDYFHFILKKHGKQLFSINGIKSEDYDWSTSEKDFNKWAQGKTGIPFVDANMIELNESGFMSNRGRQLVASFLSHDLKIDWRWGAWYFEAKLLDHDVASNWGNWAYVAGVGNDPRENRYFNILSQAKKYDQQGDYIRHWIPDLAPIEGFNIHKPSLISKEEKKALNGIDAVYFEPMVNPKKWSY